ncbi:MAG: choice-of-anchor M domain-containing protein [Verrucomicrobiota bacterium]|nr:choice-of-anchor M domain-containing protein [Verrucomicrobiota bacterium]
MNYRPLAKIGMLAICTAAAGSVPSFSQTVLSTGHADVGIAYELGAWNLHVHNHATEEEYSPSEAILQLNPESARPIPASPSFSFLGSAGTTFYVLPQVEEANLIFLGLGAEEVLAGDFAGDNMVLTLKSVTGPGNFSLYSVDGLGNPTVFMNSGNGISDGTDFVNVPAESHNHYNWAFTMPGTYTVGFEATGTHSTDGPVASGLVNYRFEVIPEPSTWALLAVGSVLVFGLQKRRK